MCGLRILNVAKAIQTGKLYEYYGQIFFRTVIVMAIILVNLSVEHKLLK